MLVDAHGQIDWYTDALPEALSQLEKLRILKMAIAMICLASTRRI